MKVHDGKHPCQHQQGGHATAASRGRRRCEIMVEGTHQTASPIGRGHHRADRWSRVTLRSVLATTATTLSCGPDLSRVLNVTSMEGAFSGAVAFGPRLGCGAAAGGAHVGEHSVARSLVRERKHMLHHVPLADHAELHGCRQSEGGPLRLHRRGNGEVHNRGCRPRRVPRSCPSAHQGHEVGAPFQDIIR